MGRMAVRFADGASPGPEERARGRGAIKGDPQALLLRFGASEAPAGATWQASWREAQIKGLIKIAGSKGINWQVTVND